MVLTPKPNPGWYLVETLTLEIATLDNPIQQSISQLSEVVFEALRSYSRPCSVAYFYRLFTGWKYMYSLPSLHNP